MRLHISAFALAVVAVPVAAQGPPPLDKAELIRLLTNPLFAPSEIAEVVRRSCLTFRPTERDWADLRNAGAGGEIIASAAACDSRRGATYALAVAESPVEPLIATAQPGEVVTAAGVGATVRVRLSRGRTPQRRIKLVLRGSTALGLSRDVAATTDDSGIAVFRVPPVARSGTHRFEIRGTSGAAFPDQPVVLYSVRPGRPGLLRPTPEYVAFGGGGDTTATVIAAVTDSLGNPISGEMVNFSGAVTGPQTAVTDSAGRAAFVVTAGAVPRGAAVQLRVRGLAPVNLEIAGPAGLSGVSSGFSPIASTSGRVGTPLSDSLVFRARTMQGGPAVGRVVRFRALNAQVSPESAVLDSTGRVRLEVTFGTRAGEAAIFASIDSLERIITLRAEPGPIDSLILERNGVTLNGKTIPVSVGAPFTMRLLARDMYGNQTSIDALGQALRANRDRLNARKPNLQIVSLESSDDAVLVTLKAQRTGTYNFVIGSGITATVRINAAP